MDTKIKNNENIKKLFLKVETVNDLVEVFNFIIDLVNEERTVKIEPIKLKALNYFLYVKKDKYEMFEIPKKTGGTRTINAPVRFWKSIQRLLNICFQLTFKPSNVANGFIEGRSIVTNANKHINKLVVYNLDLKDFFPNTNFGRVRAVLQIPPFSFSKETATFIANICTEKGSLPQGAPTSPFITNLVCQRLDKKLLEYANKNKLTYTRYADDITFSANFNLAENIKNDIKKIINDEGYTINEKKERVLYRKQRQEVTGIIVNEKLNLHREYIKTIRAMLYSWEKQGLKYSITRFKMEYKKHKGYVKRKGKIPPFENVLDGKLNFLGMVRGKEDNLYLKYKNQFDKLFKRDFESQN